MGIMGWSSTAMTARYRHMTDPIRRDIAKRWVACCGRQEMPLAGTTTRTAQRGSGVGLGTTETERLRGGSPLGSRPGLRVLPEG
jgi:hypothetical protein